MERSDVEEAIDLMELHKAGYEKLKKENEKLTALNEQIMNSVDEQILAQDNFNQENIDNLKRDIRVAQREINAKRNQKMADDSVLSCVQRLNEVLMQERYPNGH